MSGRRAKRYPRHLEAHFWPRGRDDLYRGTVANISATGLFLRSTVVVPRSTRVRLEIFSAKRESFVAEAQVIRAQRSPVHLQAVKPSGMGMRFLAVAELVEELLPGMMAKEATEPIPGASVVAGASPAPPSSDVEAPAAPSPFAEALEIEKDGEPVRQRKGRYFPLAFADPAHLRAVIERDVATGGLFVPTRDVPPMDETVVVGVKLSSPPTDEIRLEGRVVHRMEPRGTGKEDLIVGMGIQFTDVDGAIAKLRALLD